MSQEIKGFNVGGLPNDNHIMFNKMVAERAQADAAVAARFGAIITPYAAAVVATPALEVALEFRFNRAREAMIRICRDCHGLTASQ